MTNKAARFALLVLLAAAPALASGLASGCATEEEPPQDAGDTRYEDCQLWCSEVDEDVLSGPPGLCPGWNPDEDTAYSLCVGECVARHPDGHFCAAP